jgi:hypothetical protein
MCRLHPERGPGCALGCDLRARFGTWQSGVGGAWQSGVRHARPQELSRRRRKSARQILAAAPPPPGTIRGRVGAKIVLEVVRPTETERRLLRAPPPSPLELVRIQPRTAAGSRVMPRLPQVRFERLRERFHDRQARHFHPEDRPPSRVDCTWPAQGVQHHFVADPERG